MICVFSALSSTTQVRSFSMLVSAISPNRKAVTFRNRAHNSDISSREEYAFTFLIESASSDVSPQSIEGMF